MKRQICLPQLPLAVYREVAAHLRQVPGVSVELLPQTSTEFDYRQSQVGGLEIDDEEATAAAQQQVERILQYYSDRFGAWRAIAPAS
ncbi:hypothetical protein [Thermoleptolyngbya sp.]|jgi:hypothetical protein